MSSRPNAAADKCLVTAYLRLADRIRCEYGRFPAWRIPLTPAQLQRWWDVTGHLAPIIGQLRTLEAVARKCQTELPRTWYRTELIDTWVTSRLEGLGVDKANLIRALTRLNQMVPLEPSNGQVYVAALQEAAQAPREVLRVWARAMLGDSFSTVWRHYEEDHPAPPDAAIPPAIAEPAERVPPEPAPGSSSVRVARPPPSFAAPPPSNDALSLRGGPEPSSSAPVAPSIATARPRPRPAYKRILIDPLTRCPQQRFAEVWRADQPCEMCAEEGRRCLWDGCGHSCKRCAAQHRTCTLGFGNDPPSPRPTSTYHGLKGTIPRVPILMGWPLYGPDPSTRGGLPADLDPALHPSTRQQTEPLPARKRTMTTYIPDAPTKKRASMMLSPVRLQKSKSGWVRQPQKEQGLSSART